MLLKVDYSVIESLRVVLTFDDDSVKVREISEGDLIRATYNDNGRRKEIEGKIIKIGINHNPCTCSKNSWYVIVDGSMSYCGDRVRFSPANLLDLDIILKHTDVELVGTPSDSDTSISMIRVNDNVLEVSRDHGLHWIPINELLGEFEPIQKPDNPDDPEDPPVEGDDDMFTEEDRKLLADGFKAINDNLTKINEALNATKDAEIIEKIGEVKTDVAGVQTSVSAFTNDPVINKIETVGTDVNAVSRGMDAIQNVIEDMKILAENAATKENMAEVKAELDKTNQFMETLPNQETVSGLIDGSTDKISGKLDAMSITLNAVATKLNATFATVDSIE